jgi:hypothetical protein
MRGASRMVQVRALCRSGKTDVRMWFRRRHLEGREADELKMNGKLGACALESHNEKEEKRRITVGRLTVNRLKSTTGWTVKVIAIGAVQLDCIEPR